MLTGYNRARTAQGAIAECTFVKAGTLPGTAAQASTATDPFLGLAMQFNNPADGDRVDVVVYGPCKITVGSAAVADCAFLTSNAEGLAITATGSNRVGAMALQAGQPGDVIDAIAVPSLL